MNTEIVTLTQVQEAAVTHLLRSKRPNAVKVRRKACRMVRSYCEKQGYKETEIPQLVRDMLDVYELERNAE